MHKSASSPGWALSLASPASSGSSLQSAGSVLQRRPAAPDSLTVRVAEEEHVPHPNPSPQYAEPWDRLTCVHGAARECPACSEEADSIVSQCHNYNYNMRSSNV